MAKISDLSEQGSVASTDKFEIETTTPASLHITAATLAAYLLGEIAPDFTLSPGAMAPTAGAPSLSPVATYASGWHFDPSVNEETAAAFMPPDDWSTMNVDFYWVNSGGGSGDVRWVVGTQALEDGDTVGTWSLAGNNYTADTLNKLVISRVATGMAVSAGDFTVLRFNRGAVNAGDTLANDAALLAVKLSKES